MSNLHILDPLWITKGSNGLDPEYHKYVLLAANQKYRKMLDEGDESSFYEILFHSLNLNNLAVEGSVFKFNMTPVWEDKHLIEIRDHLRRIYELPDDIIEIFKNANYLLTNLMLDYLDKILQRTEDTRQFFVNPKIHQEKEVFIVINKENDMLYDVWKLKFDKRYKFGYRLTNPQDIILEDLRENALHDAIVKENNPELSNMDADANVLFTVTTEDHDRDKLATAVAMSILFSRGISREIKFEPNILDELYELLSQEKVLPFTMQNWI
jgi:hypothetical protein